MRGKAVQPQLRRGAGRGPQPFSRSRASTVATGPGKRAGRVWSLPTNGRWPRADLSRGHRRQPLRRGRSQPQVRRRRRRGLGRPVPPPRAGPCTSRSSRHDAARRAGDRGGHPRGARRRSPPRPGRRTPWWSSWPGTARWSASGITSSPTSSAARPALTSKTTSVSQAIAADELCRRPGAAPALKRMLILDTCASGGAVAVAMKGRSGSPLRGAIERLSPDPRASSPSRRHRPRRRRRRPSSSATAC